MQTHPVPCLACCAEALKRATRPALCSCPHPTPCRNSAVQTCDLGENYAGLFEVPVWGLTALGGPYTLNPGSDNKQDVYDILKVGGQPSLLF